jgi:hypothetical protein
VAWDFADEPVPTELRAGAAALAARVDGGLGDRLAGLLARDEVTTLSRRLAQAAALDVFPTPRGPRPFPWPLL